MAVRALIEPGAEPAAAALITSRDEPVSRSTTYYGLAVDRLAAITLLHGGP